MLFTERDSLGRPASHWLRGRERARRGRALCRHGHERPCLALQSMDRPVTLVIGGVGAALCASHSTLGKRQRAELRFELREAINSRGEHETLCREGSGGKHIERAEGSGRHRGLLYWRHDAHRDSPSTTAAPRDDRQDSTLTWVIRLPAFHARLAVLESRHDIGARAIESGEHREGGRIQNDRFRTSLAVGEQEQPAFEVPMLPFEFQNFSHSCACQNRQPDCRHDERVDGRPAPSFLGCVLRGGSLFFSAMSQGRPIVSASRMAPPSLGNSSPVRKRSGPFSRCLSIRRAGLTTAAQRTIISVRSETGMFRHLFFD
jgi:hypothetical protein